MAACVRFSDCRNPREVSEDWFDAKEDLAGTDFSAVQDNHVELGGGDPKATLGWCLTVTEKSSPNSYTVVLTVFSLFWGTGLL